MVEKSIGISSVDMVETSIGISSVDMVERSMLEGIIVDMVDI